MNYYTPKDLGQMHKIKQSLQNSQGKAETCTQGLSVSSLGRGLHSFLGPSLAHTPSVSHALGWGPAHKPFLVEVINSDSWQ